MSSWASDSTAIVAALASSWKAWRRADADAHFAIFDDSAIMIFRDPDRTPVWGLAEMRAMAADVFKEKSLPVLRSAPVLVKSLGPDLTFVVSRGSLKEGEVEVPTLVTQAWRRRPTGWRVVTNHGG